MLDLIMKIEREGGHVYLESIFRQDIAVDPPSYREQIEVNRELAVYVLKQTMRTAKWLPLLKQYQATL